VRPVRRSVSLLEFEHQGRTFFRTVASSVLGNYESWEDPFSVSVSILKLTFDPGFGWQLVFELGKKDGPRTMWRMTKNLDSAGPMSYRLEELEEDAEPLELPGPGSSLT
jgi:hypothetical protein